MTRYYDWCKVCNRFDRTATHICPPLYKCQAEKYHEDHEWFDIYADSHEDAARQLGERIDNYGDYRLVNGGEAIISVCKEGDVEITKYVVRGEMVPRYRAEKLEDE